MAVTVSRRALLVTAIAVANWRIFRYYPRLGAADHDAPADCSISFVERSIEDIVGFGPEDLGGRVVEILTDSDLVGDIVEVDSSSDCEGAGRTSLAAALAQRALLRTESGCGRVANVRSRDLWLAIANESCVGEVEMLFGKHDFSVLHDARGNDDRQQLAQTGSEFSIRLLVGNLNETLPDSSIRDTALLSINGDGGGRDEQHHVNTLQILFSLYRKVRLNGTIIIEHFDVDFKTPSHTCKAWTFCWVNDPKYESPECEGQRWTNELADCSFFTDSTHGFRRLGTGHRYMKKADRQVRVPKFFRNTLSIDPRLEAAWDELQHWHKQTVRRFVGHVGTNKFQTYRYIEAMRHVTEREIRRTEGRDKARVNVCETGFNGGHSSMLFMSYLSDEADVHYYGWDLKEVGSSEPVARKMRHKYGPNFRIKWGNSHETLKTVESDMDGQLCDLIVIDGDHSKRGVVDDLTNLLRVAKPGALIFADDCAPHKRTVPASPFMLEGWMEFIAAGKVISVANYRNPEMQSPGFVEGLVPDEDGGYSLEL